jgi:hypothetical protein
MVTQARVIDARRVLLFSSTRALQTSAQLGSVRRQRSELHRDLERADDRLRVRLLAEIQETLPQTATSRARLASIAERLRLAGLPVPTAETGEPSFVVVRTGEQGATMLRATLQTLLQPGDVVDVVRGPAALPAGGLVAMTRPGAPAVERTP